MTGVATTGVVTALRVEARSAGLPRGQKWGSVAGSGDVLVAVGGIGAKAATGAATALLAAGANRLVSWGMAGGLDPALTAGRICVPSAVVSRSGASFDVDEGWREAVCGLALGSPIVGGRLLTSDLAIVDVAAKKAAFRDTGAAAVDMESVAVARVAHASGVPFLAIRSIVDTATDAIPAVVLAATVGGEVRIGRLLLAVLRAPGAVAPLCRLSARYSSATRALAAVARRGALGLQP